MKISWKNSVSKLVTNLKAPIQYSELATAFKSIGYFRGAVKFYDQYLGSAQ
jgi:hypothetical protein